MPVPALSNKDCVLALNNNIPEAMLFAKANCNSLLAHFYRNFKTQQSTDYDIQLDPEDGQTDSLRQVYVVGWSRNYFSTDFSDGSGSPEV